MEDIFDQPEAYEQGDDRTQEDSLFERVETARQILANLVADVRALASAFEFYIPASAYAAEAWLDGASDPIDEAAENERRACAALVYEYGYVSAYEAILRRGKGPLFQDEKKSLRKLDEAEPL